jgi:hypothetical protein
MLQASGRKIIANHRLGHAAPTDLPEDRDFGVIGVRLWRLADLGSNHALLPAGMLSDR